MQELLLEIASLGPVRIQQVWALKSTLILELYHQAHKRLYLIADFSQDTPSLHVQQGKPLGIKTTSPLVLVLRKYITGKIGRFNIITNNNHALIFSSNNTNNKIIFDYSIQPSIAFLGDNVSVFSHQDRKPQLGPESSVAQPSNLQANYTQAERYACIKEKYTHKAAQEQLQNLQSSAQKKLARLRKNLQADLEKFEHIIARKNDAELLRVNLHNIKKGDKEILLTDYSHIPSQQKLIILDPALSPQVFLELLFKKIKKAERGIDYISKRLAQLEESPLVKMPLTRIGKAHPEARLPYKIFTSSDGIPLWVGKSARDNDRLSLHHARGNEWWFHVREGSGSHVVVKSSDDALKSSTLTEAAMLAAYFSKHRHDTNAEVIYTRIKYIKKPKKAAAGLVVVEQEKSIYVHLDYERIKRLIDAG